MDLSDDISESEDDPDKRQLKSMMNNYLSNFESQNTHFDNQGEFHQFVKSLTVTQRQMIYNISASYYDLLVQNVDFVPNQIPSKQ